MYTPYEMLYATYVIDEKISIDIVPKVLRPQVEEIIDYAISVKK